MASTIKVNNIQNQCGANIISESANTITLGASGDNIVLGAGATQSGFGRTGTVDWDTTAKTGNFTAVSGNGYFVNTTAGAITLTLPATPSAGDIVSFKDYAFTFATNNLTVDGNGSPIGGVDGTIPVTYSTNGTSKTFVYVDGTKGWLVVNESTDTSQESNNVYITATGGTITTSGDYKIHTFTGPGTFCVSAGNGPVAVVDYLVIAGGGAGTGGTTNDGGSGGGGGGFRLSNTTCMPAPQTSPLASSTALPMSIQAYPVTVGAGGNGGSSGNINPGSNSIFSTITSAGGGGGAHGGNTPNVAGAGGSGGGGHQSCGGAGNTPPVSPPQGNPGGNGAGGPGGIGGGGAGAAAPNHDGSAGGTPGGAGSYVVGTGFAGANGTTGPICGARYFAGGGGGSNSPTRSPAGSNGSGGVGGGTGGGTCGTCAAANTGGGSGGFYGTNGWNAGSGIVIIRYKYQ